jgi:hypothetical protein
MGCSTVAIAAITVTATEALGRRAYWTACQSNYVLASLSM